MTQIILIAATSIDGRITRGETEGNTFTSAADQVWFKQALAKMDAVLMGRKTYDTVAARLQARRQNPAVPRIIFTRSPELFSGYAGAGLQFTAETPQACIRRLNTGGMRRVALVGGAELHACFLNEGLVDEVWLTLEPVIFGRGKLLAPEVGEVTLELYAHTFLSSQSILLKYRVK